MKRREFISHSGALATGSLMLSASACDNRETAARRPNIVLIVSDDTGWNDVGYHGSEIQTPVIDMMAENGAELDSYYVYPTCSPTRAALLTGRPPSRFGILGPIAMRSTQTLPKDSGTLPSVLAGAGYDTAITGKWHLGLRPECGPNEYGFQYSYGYLHGQIDQFTHIYKNGDRSWHRNGEFIDEDGHATDLITDEAIRFINREREQPFFLYVPCSVPHYPLQEDERWTGIYSDIGNESRRIYAASMTHMDNAIGRILDTLKEKRIDKDTLVIFASDNGGQENWTPTFEYDGKFAANDRLGDNSPLRGWKGDVYEGGIRVPAVFYWPGRIEHSTVSRPLIAWDIMPTITKLTGAETPAAVEGTDIWRTITTGEGTGERIFYWRTPNQLAVRKGPWKLVHNAPAPGKGSDELFDIAADPLEKNDISTQEPSRLHELKELLALQFSQDNEPEE